MSWSILIIEDDTECREPLVQILAARGYRAVGAVDGKAALDRVHLDGWRPSLIVLDLMMPNMDGHEFLRVRATDSLLAQVPVIVLTATGTRRVPATPPVAAVIQKPYKLNALLQTIEESCHSRITRPMAPLTAEPVPSAAPSPAADSTAKTSDAPSLMAERSIKME
jgi:CheY-like chemotaxis protein